MSFDKYSDKAAEAIALIREFAKVEYWDFFKGDPEQALESFCAMQDAAEEMGRMNERQACTARIEELAKVARFALEYIDGFPKDLPNSAAGFDRDWAEQVIDLATSTAEEKNNG